MRGAIILVLSFALAGCSAPDDGLVPEPFPAEVYRYQYPGSDVAVEGHPHGWLVRVHNPTDETWDIVMTPFGVDNGTFGPIGRTGGASPSTVFLPQVTQPGQSVPSPRLLLGPGEASVFLMNANEYAGDGVVRTGFRMFADPVTIGQERAVQSIVREWNVTVQAAGTAVEAGDHVSTATVGVYEDGTTFYTNIEAVATDPLFPDACLEAACGTFDPLGVYVYGQSRDEQPPGSIDACRSTTISGYNALLKTQAEGSTNVRLLQPGAAYTQQGREDHPLYGSALIFLNTVVGHDGTTGTEDEVSDPDGPCFPCSLETAQERAANTVGQAAPIEPSC